MATTETTETTETLRAAIEAAMRRRDPGVRVSVTPAAGQTLASVDGPSSALVWGSSMADTADEALRRLARGFGLRDDGSDPVAEVERLTQDAAHDAGPLAPAARGRRRVSPMGERLTHTATEDARRRTSARREPTGTRGFARGCRVRIPLPEPKERHESA